MAAHGWQQTLLLVSLIGPLGGCASVPPAPAVAQTAPPPSASRTNQQEDEYEGWLFKRLTGQGTPAQAQPPSPAAVVPASATQPVPLPPVSAQAGMAATPLTPIAAPAAAPLANTAPPLEPEPEPESEESSGFDLSQLAPENMWKNVKKATGYGPNEGVAQALFDEGKSLFAAKKYSEAASKFSSAAGRWPDSVLEEDAMFWLGESHFFADQYPKAQNAYDNLLKKYDNSRHLDTVVKRLFAIGQYWEKLNDKDPHWRVTPNVTDKTRPFFDTFGNAIKAYDVVRMKDPTGPLADDALLASANAYFRRGQWDDAAFNYELLMKQYPKSEHMAVAHPLALEAKLRSYQGAKYDGKPLEDAHQIANRALTQFPGELGAERSRVAETRDRITEMQAERDWAIGQYYDKRKWYGSARMYYQDVVKHYPLSQAAKQARERLEQIRNEPDTPPNHFKWLTDILPASEK